MSAHHPTTLLFISTIVPGFWCCNGPAGLTGALGRDTARHFLFFNVFFSAFGTRHTCPFLLSLFFLCGGWVLHKEGLWGFTTTPPPPLNPPYKPPWPIQLFGQHFWCHGGAPKGGAKHRESEGPKLWSPEGWSPELWSPQEIVERIGPKHHNHLH